MQELVSREGIETGAVKLYKETIFKYGVPWFIVPQIVGNENERS